MVILSVQQQFRRGNRRAFDTAGRPPQGCLDIPTSREINKAYNNKCGRTITAILKDGSTVSSSAVELVYLGVKSMIRGGDYPPGQALATENELAAQYGVSRGTVRQALSRLAQEGYVESSQGVRWRVREENSVRIVRLSGPELIRGSSRPDIPPGSFGKYCENRGLKPRDERLQGPHVVPCYELAGDPRPLEPEIVRKALQIKMDTRVVWFERLRYLREDVPVGLQWAVFPHDLFKKVPMTSDDMRPGGVTDWLQANGIRRERVDPKYRATSADDYTALRLNVRHGEALLQETRVSVYRPTVKDKRPPSELPRCEYSLTLFTQWIEIDYDPLEPVTTDSNSKPSRNRRKA